jgi:hypothetical protein
MLPNQTNGQPPGNAPKRGGAGSRRGRRSAAGPTNETPSDVGSPNDRTAAQSSSANGKVSRGGAANRRGVADGSPARGRGQGTPRRGGGLSQRGAGSGSAASGSPLGGMDWRASPRGGAQAGHNTSRQTYSGPTGGGQGRRGHFLLEPGGYNQRCHLSLLTNSALVYEPICGGGGGAGSPPMSIAAQLNSGGLTSILNLWLKLEHNRVSY